MIFQSSIISLHFFTSDNNSGEVLSPLIKTPLPSSGSNLEYIEMNYSIDYEIGTCPLAENFANKSINLPTNINITAKDAMRIVDIINIY